MTLFVLDCSVTMAWCFEDEADPYADDVLRSLDSSSAIAPAIWGLEVANALVIARRRGRITEAGLMKTLSILRALKVEMHHLMPAQLWTGVLSLAQEHELTSYDAAYLFVALQEGAALATIDQRMRRAASAAGVEIYTSV